MSKKINILMLDNMMNTNSELLSDDCVKKYLELEEIKSQELTTVQRLCQYLKTTSLFYQFYENYYLNYKIPQIGKEFDLLRIGRESVVNIELKSGQVSDEEVLTQLKRNYYYLSFLGRTIHCYTFMTDGTQDILFYFDVTTQELQRISDKNHILCNLYRLNDIEDTIIDSLFVPSNYLISPFNTTDKFIENQYFLTQHQEDIKKEIIKSHLQIQTIANS